MNKVIELLLANLPLIISVLAALGMWKIGAALLHTVATKAREIAKGTKNPIDDIVVGVIATQLDEIADQLEKGNVDEAKRRLGIVKLQSKPVLQVLHSPQGNGPRL